jgi:hypothetical protein
MTLYYSRNRAVKMQVSTLVGNALNVLYNGTYNMKTG